MNKTKLGILISGGGSNMQSIADACASGILKDKAEIAVVISNKPAAYGLERAKNCGIPAVCIERKVYENSSQFCEALIAELKSNNVDLVCLAGFLLKLEPVFIQAFPGRILNIHPALLPKFGGKGMYGHFVHEAVIAAGEKESGATVHWVDEEYDHGQTVLQQAVPVKPDDTPETLAERVLEVEHRIYPEAISKVNRDISLFISNCDKNKKGDVPI